jgi:spore coat polysaccharide biosynthesis protein SpsF (cytidylyltransferase family)
VENDEDLSGLRWTLDTGADLRFAREVYAQLYHGQVFLMKEILALLSAEPRLGQINAETARNAGYLASLKRDGSGKKPTGE